MSDPWQPRFGISQLELQMTPNVSPVKKGAKPEHNILATLQFTDKKRAETQRPGARDPRTAVIAFLDEQASFIRADIEGIALSLKKMRTKTNENGQRVKVETIVQPRRSYWKHEDQHFFNVKLGNVPVEFAPGKSSVIAGRQLEDVLSTVEKLRQATIEGELDEMIAVASEKVRERVSKRNRASLNQ